MAVTSRRFSLSIFALYLSNTFALLDNRRQRKTLRRCRRTVCKRGCGEEGIDQPRLAQELSRQLADFVQTQRTKAGDPVQAIEIPSILRQADEVADRRIGCPGPAKRRARQVQRYSRRKEWLDVRSALDRLDRRQRGR